ncbi:hypothetical protein H8K52_09245 [Undibacterium seohonense]|uniref:Uncharacterized protein n=1 Tax=Undibacterium seohonense TaxID=1344950 RepID=A0ABR6X3L3_9BURK|nr:hypothetical protein [Undibacterium seohonense]MBC3807528.1 hypothetical protein [Undibacterium seohonense]
MFTLMKSKKPLLAVLLSTLFCTAPVYATKLSAAIPEKLVAFEFHTLDIETPQSGTNAANAADKDQNMRLEVMRNEVFIKHAPRGALLTHAQSIRMGEKIIKNAPYSAEVITENQQKLADGNVIANKVSMLTYRDSQGRTREEIRDPKGEIRTIIINDPEVSRIVLNPKSKTALKMMPIASMKAGKPALNIVTENITKAADGKDVIELKLAAEGDKQGERHVVIRRAVKSADGKVISGDVERNMTIDVRGSESGRNMEMQTGSAGLDANFSRIFSDAKWSAKRQTKVLGSRDFDGIKADGKVQSYEIPAGEIGNVNPILVSDESWTSPELQITLYSKHSDPRSGERIYRLSNVKRDEVPANMFAVPNDYKLSDLSEMGKVMKFDSNDKTDKTDKAEKMQRIEKEIRIEKK